jgi:anti-sigma factor RsiW
VAKLSCSEASECLLDFVEGALDPKLRHSIEDHMRVCPPCGRLLEAYNKAAALCGKALQREPPAGMGERLLASLREKTSYPPRNK